MKAAHLSAGAVALVGLAACASSPHSHSPAPSPPSAAVDASYDWHGLVTLPFGMLLKESPLPLHEVLLFRDSTHPAADAENKDCFSIDGKPPLFVGQIPDPYLLCFDHDRLSRIEASVQVAAADAPAVFARACALWLKSAPNLGGGATCEGLDDAVAFSGRLAVVPGEAEATLSMTLSPRP